MPEFDESTGYRMGGSKFYGHGNAAPKYASPAKETETKTKTKTEVTNKQRQENLLKAVPNEEAYNKLPPADQKGFTDAWVKSKGATKQVKKKKEE